jgi:AraC-like DNA-binding protein
VLIAARLAGPMLAHVRVVAAREHAVVPVDGWDALEREVRTSAAEVAVVDPCAGGSGTEELGMAVRAVRAVSRVVPVVVYTSVTAASARAMVELGDERGVRSYIFRGVDDEASRFRERLEEFRSPVMECGVVGPLRAALAESGAPDRVAEAVRGLFETPRRYHTAADLAAAAGMTPQHVNRVLAAAGIATAHVVVIGARVVRAYQYAAVPGATLTEIATRLRYREARALTRHVRAIVGREPSSIAAWRAGTTPEGCVAQVVSRLFVRRQAPARRQRP